MYLQRLNGCKTFISVSSSNVEFAYLFNVAKSYANTFEDVTLAISDTFSARLLNGGYPINFDRKTEWEPREDIQLTRALLYAGVYEALTSNSPTNSVKPLRPSLERSIVECWHDLSKRRPGSDRL